jgi:hypothetical protein
MDRPGRLGASLALLSITALAAAGCGGKETDVSSGIDSYNERLSQQGIPARLDCPDRVDGHEGTEFQCTLEATQGGRNAKITMEIRKEGKDLIVIEKDQQALERAVQEVAGQAQQGQGQQGGAQPPAQGGAQPPAGGGAQPPAGGGAQPPAQQPPAQGGE